MYHSLLFSLPEDIHMQAFYRTALGELYQAIPFEELSKTIPAPRRAVGGRGCQPWFDVKGGIALQVLKSYYRCSDAMLIEQLNGNWQMQLFCGIRLANGQQIKDKDIVGRWRSYLGRHLNIDQLQLRCVQHWKPYMQHVHTGFTDATVFESYITYPTDAKLLWNACGKVYQLIKNTRRELKLRHTRINHQKRKAGYLSFAKRRKKSKRQNKKICKSLLKYLQSLLKQLQIMEQKYDLVVFGGRYAQRLQTIQTLLEQQWKLYFGGESKVPNRIVSLHKPYVRPIVRGKEVKPVEFGAKVNMLVVDGISFLEHLSYDNFNEGTRLQSTIDLQQRYFGGCYQIGADAIYATNENRRYCTTNGITTSFVPKGNQGPNKEQKSQMRSILGKIRSTVVEGSFGNEKNHYHLDKVKAKTQGNEKVWIFFSLLTCNSRQMAHRMKAMRTASTCPPLKQVA